MSECERDCAGTADCPCHFCEEVRAPLRAKLAAANERAEKAERERDEGNVCEHGDHLAPYGKRFCSDECDRCEHNMDDDPAARCHGCRVEEDLEAERAHGARVLATANKYVGFDDFCTCYCSVHLADCGIHAARDEWTAALAATPTGSARLWRAMERAIEVLNGWRTWTNGPGDSVMAALAEVERLKNPAREAEKEGGDGSQR